MRAWGLVCVLAAASACYRGASELPSCTVECDPGCPSGMTCSNGYCTSGGTCGVETDAGSTCGQIGQACCGDEPTCASNGMCVAGTCQAGCVADISPGRRHTCAVRHDGTVWCAGYNADGELGNGAMGSGSATFGQVSDSAGPISDATAVGAGAYHTCAVRAGGHVSCWGYNYYGELGDNTTNGSALAVEVQKTTLEPLANIVEVQAGNYFSCGRDTTGGVWCWGRNDHGQLGDGTITDRHTASQVLNGGAAFTKATAFAVERGAACALDSDTHLWCWGRDDGLELGNGGTADSPNPVQIIDATSFALNAHGGCAVLADTSVKCWGAGWQGRVGNGTQADAPTPTPAMIDATTPLTGVIQVAGGGVACAVTSDHRALCWGDNPHGQNGNGAGSLYPAPVTRGTSVARLVAHYTRVCAFGTGGNLRCWGRNTEGELGDGTFDNVGAPEPIAALCP